MAAAAADEVKFSLKVMINKEKTKVLFAEVDNHFADVLLSFLTLPMGTIVRLLRKHYGDQAPVLGSLNTLYDGLANLDDVHFWAETGKLMLLNPRNSFEAECRKLKLNIDETEPIKYFACENHGWSRISLYYCPAKCPECGKSMNEVFIEDSSITATAVDDGVFTESYNFLISDDLRMAPNLTGSILETLSNLGIDNIDGATLRTVTIGFNGVMDLLKGSLLSRTPFTDLILSNRQVYPATVKSEIDCIQKSASNSMKMTVKAMMQKSTNKLLFVEGDSDFVDFLFSLLTIPVGGVISLFSGKISVGSLDNLYGSDANSGGKCLKSVQALLKPKLPPKYRSYYRILVLEEQEINIYYDTFEGKKRLRSYSSFRCERASLIDPKGNESYVKGPRMFMIMDDLKVTPLCLISGLSVLNSMKIPLTDVEEQTVDIGMEEGLRILEASLSSTSVLSNGLKHKFKKQTKQEH